jgi:hypothetical protein
MKITTDKSGVRIEVSEHDWIAGKIPSGIPRSDAPKVDLAPGIYCARMKKMNAHNGYLSTSAYHCARRSAAWIGAG